MKPDYSKKSSLSIIGDHHYSEEDQEHYQAIFEKIKQNDRRMWRKTFVIIFISVGVYYLIGISLWDHPIATAFWIIGGFVIPLPALAPVLLASAELKCPACRKNLFRPGLEVGNYCPECGARDLKLKGWLAHLYCESCHKQFVDSKYGRNYKVRICTYCGLLFSKSGY